MHLQMAKIYMQKKALFKIFDFKITLYHFKNCRQYLFSLMKTQLFFKGTHELQLILQKEKCVPILNFVKKTHKTFAELWKLDIQRYFFFCIKTLTLYHRNGSFILIVNYCINLHSELLAKTFYIHVQLNKLHANGIVNLEKYVKTQNYLFSNPNSHIIDIFIEDTISFIFTKKYVCLKSPSKHFF